VTVRLIPLEGELMNVPSRWWLAPIAVLILLSYVVPYTVLSDVDRWYGSFLFWSLATAAVIAINAVISLKWKD